MIECKHGVLPHGAVTCRRCESEGIEKPYWRRIPLYRFVTARLKGVDDCRQGFLLSYSPLRIQGESGAVYECEGRPREVVNQPQKTVISMRNVHHCLMCHSFIGPGNDPALCRNESCLAAYKYERDFNRFAAKEMKKEKNQCHQNN